MDSKVCFTFAAVIATHVNPSALMRARNLSLRRFSHGGQQDVREAFDCTGDAKARQVDPSLA
jgi:hypothetical protein